MATDFKPVKLCSAEDCNHVAGEPGASQSSGLCNKHYKRFMKHGDVNITNRRMPEDGHKECPRCLETKPLADFTRLTQRNGNATYTYCAPCRKEYAKERYARDRERLLERHREDKYGVTAEQFAFMVIEQGGRCYLCRKEDTRGLSVDHNHETGVIRKLLCSKCNVAVGMIDEDAELAERIAAYLREWQ